MPFQNYHPMPIDAASNPPLYGRIANPVGEDLILFQPYIDRTALSPLAGVLKLYASQDGINPTGPAIATISTNTGSIVGPATQPGCGLWPADHDLILVVDSGDPTGIQGTLYLQWLYT